jgi:type VII secretion-associated serine protease mycosin
MTISVSVERGECRRCARIAARVVIVALACFILNALTAPGAGADTIRNQEWIVQALSLPEAHVYSEGQGITVAVLDTGVNSKHVDLRGNVLAGTDFTTGSARGTGGNDTAGHGTEMAGLIAGHGHGVGKKSGILGIAPLAKILPVRLSVDDSGNGGADGDAIKWATAHGASVICMAFGGPNTSTEIANAMLAAYRANIVLVAAAGNVTQGDQIVQYPAAYPGVVAVAGTDEHGNHSKVSVTGNLITIAAPSDNIPSTYNNGGYAIGSGTSSSTAIVAGAAALVRSRFPNLTAGEVVNRLTATAIDKGPPGRDDEYGYGLLNLVGALTAKVPPAGSTTASSSASASPATTTPATTSNQIGSLAPATRSTSTTIISVVAVIVLLIAFLIAWILVRRRRPG